MSSQARLISIDAVERLRTALIKFGEAVAAALADLDLEVGRAVAWVQDDRKVYWANEVRQGWDRVTQARANLERRMIYRVSEERPSALEEKKTLEAAKRRLEIAQQKLAAVRRWSYIVQRERDEYFAVISQLAGWLQGDFPKAVAMLKRMAGALEAYVAAPVSAEAQQKVWQTTAQRLREAITLLESEQANEEKGPSPCEDSECRSPLSRSSDSEPPCVPGT